MDKFYLSTLIYRVSEGDIRALEKIFNEMKDSIFAFVLMRTNNRQLSEDILQETMLQIYNSAKSYKKFSNPKAWILTIARNNAVSAIRKTSREQELNIQKDNNTTSLLIDSKINAMEMLSVLSEDQREIVILHAISGLKHKEIAKLLDIPLGTVCWKYNESIKILRKLKLTEKGVCCYD
ncbi:MAG: ECF RNA polymerase sigma factor SigH [Firmicutes bacterium ADurb.Bin419]|nr:MAG: ECF RNA polymerase sigma factor SigH [Firmicutes bacterium ADurb.Bin419]